MQVSEIARLIGGRLIRGDAKDRVTGIGSIFDALPDEIIFLSQKRYLSLLRETPASCLLISEEIELSDVELPAGLAVISVEEPFAAFETVVGRLAQPRLERFPGIDKSAVVAPTAILGKGVHIGPLCVIEPDVEIGAESVLIASVYVGRGSRVGDRCLLYPNVSIMENITIGNKVVIHSGAAIGSDGFGYAPDKEGKLQKQSQYGTVIIEDDVEIGAGAAIDRARFARTRIGRGTKIDNLVHIAHNVIMGKSCILAGQAGIAGSVRVGDNTIFAGQVGVADHIKIGSNVRAAAQAGVGSDIGDNRTVSGHFAWDHMKDKRSTLLVRRLPEMKKELVQLKERIARLEERAEDNKR